MAARLELVAYCVHDVPAVTRPEFGLCYRQQIAFLLKRNVIQTEPALLSPARTGRRPSFIVGVTEADVVFHLLA